MKNLSIPVGVSDFEEIRRKGYYYVDKSMLIAKLLKDEGTKVTLITRPRRFGKTLGMSMLANFFDVRKDSRDIFEGLEIAGERELCEKWRNQCPTLFLSLKRVDGLDFQNAYGMLCSALAELCVEHQYLLGSDRVETYDKRLFSRAMWAYYGKRVVLLIDEYDVPVAKSNSHGYYLEMLDVMNYLRDIQEQPGKKPASYWKNTSDNAIIRSFIDYAGNSITNKLETLLAGGLFRK